VRRGPRAKSRTTSSVHRSPTHCNAPITGQPSPWRRFMARTLGPQSPSSSLKANHPHAQATRQTPSLARTAADQPTRSDCASVISGTRAGRGKRRRLRRSQAAIAIRRSMRSSPRKSSSSAAMLVHHHPDVYCLEAIGIAKHEREREFRCVQCSRDVRQQRSPVRFARAS